MLLGDIFTKKKITIVAYILASRLFGWFDFILEFASFLKYLKINQFKNQTKPKFISIDSAH